jgi:hypothetical protein
MFNEHDRRVINNSFGGDEKAFLTSIAEGRRKTLKWGDILAAATILPELKNDARFLIQYYLGYIPENFAMLPQEPFLRALFNNYKNGSLRVDELFDQAEEHIVYIRNETVKQHLDDHFKFSVYQKYDSYIPQASQLVRERLTRFLGYEPDIQHSAVVEMNLRAEMMDDKNYFPENEITVFDIQALTAIKYREVLLSKGKVAANASPLIAEDLRVHHTFVDDNYR